MTLSNAAAARVRLIVWCKECHHQVEPDPAAMAAQYGAETPVPDWRKRLICSPLRQPAGRYGGDRDEAVRAVPQDDITSRRVRGDIVGAPSGGLQSFSENMTASARRDGVSFKSLIIACLPNLALIVGRRFHLFSRRAKERHQLVRMRSHAKLVTATQLYEGLPSYPEGDVEFEQKPFDRKTARQDASAAALKVSHSHTMSTSQPRAFNSHSLRASRSMLSLNLVSQNSARVLGLVVRRHPEWRCQKHPCTKITFLKRGKTRSGVPGRLRRWSRKRYPWACISRRTTISGLEFLALTRPMRTERIGSIGCPARVRWTASCGRGGLLAIRNSDARLGF
jgi:hypothetical protein